MNLSVDLERTVVKKEENMNNENNQGIVGEKENLNQN